MIFILASFGYWFSQLSSIPQTLIINYSNKIPFFLTWLLRKLECTKCVCFWLGIAYGFNKYELIDMVVFGGLCSFIGIVINRVYYKVLS